MRIDIDVKLFIENYIELIEKGFWDLLYRRAANEYLPHIGRITLLLAKAGINPLSGTTRIPPFFFEYIEVEPSKKLNFKDAESIGEFAFSNCESLSTIELPNIKTIERFAFLGCKDLKWVFLGASLESLRECVFSDCPLLEVLNFGGTLELWAKVNKPETWSTGSKVEKICCTDGDIELK